MLESDEIKELPKRMAAVEKGVEGVARGVVEISTRLSRFEEKQEEFKNHTRNFLAEFNRQSDKTDTSIKDVNKLFEDLKSRVRSLEAQMAKLSKK